nr:hypothetical protein [Tanacetum cinerariifolium]
MIVEDTSSKVMVAIDRVGFDWSYMADDEVPTNMALMAFLDLELPLKRRPKKRMMTKLEAYLDTMSIDYLYNNFKIVEQEVKRTIDSSSSSGSPNMAFFCSPGSTNEVDTASIQVSAISTLVSTVSSHDTTANLSDATVYVFLANQPTGSQLVHEDLEQIYEDDLEEIDLKWQLALLSMRARRYFQRTGKKITINESDTDGVGFTSYNAVAPPPTCLFAPLFIDLSNFGLEEFQHPELRGYGHKDSKSVCIDTSNEIKNFAPTTVLTKFGIVPIGTARQSSSRAAAPVSAGRPINTAASKPLGTPQEALKDQGYFNNGCSGHMTGNISYLTDFQEHDGEVMKEFCEEKGIKREYSVARTPQQNRVAERRNRTLIKAARTMLADSKLPTTFWAEAVSTACFVQNRVLVVKPHFKTPYELFKGRSPALSFMRPFGCHVSILNTTSKAFRVYNIRTRKVGENLHITFLENEPMIAGGGPEWLFDLDAFLKSMNYAPVSACNNSNDFAGKGASFDAGQSSMETGSSQDYILMPL